MRLCIARLSTILHTAVSILRKLVILPQMNVSEKDELPEVEVQVEALVSAEEDPWEKIIRETFEKDGIEKERKNKASSNVVTPAKGLRSNQANDYDNVYFNEEANEVKEENAKLVAKIVELE
ncbi:1174_t:CDS:2, partial [Funneliformis mosseae]